MVGDEEGVVLDMTWQLTAPRERVFDAWSSLEAMTQWLVPATCQVLGGEVDFREGGRYRLEGKTEESAKTLVTLLERFPDWAAAVREQPALADVRKHPSVRPLIGK